MARDQVRTQVLLLHSEQSTLDRLSAGFDDRYTVHCATSGTEALNTLGDTPIHVIVSARDLPGMSGVEALREAKKRSPETIGILLAGDNDKGLEALVGDKEVFQVVRGGIKADELTRLVDNATRQMRLLALAESANDTAANPDEPAAEHIVMETSENGSAIISDGTGTLPALDPQKVASAVAAGSNKVDVLVLTKDDEFLTTIRESTRGMHNVHYANTLAQAEQAIAGGKVGVAVVDAAMVGENVEKLTQHLRRKANRLVNIVAGRRDDGEMLMDLINRGKVYRFLLKPVSPGRARLAIEASVKHHLEAPETAFQAGGRAAPAPRTTPAPAAKPGAAARLRAVPASAAPEARPAAKGDKPAPAGTAPAMPDALGDAFGDDKSFTETMTGIVTNFGKALTKKKDKPAEAAPETRRVEPSLPVPSRERTKPAGTTPGSGPAAPADPVAAGDGGSPFTRPKVLGGAAAAIVVVAALGFFLFGGTDEPAPRKGPGSATSSSPPAAASTSSRQPALQPAPADGNALLGEARLARQAGQVYNPPGSNAIELYAEALSNSPDNPEIIAEFDAVIEEALRMAETAMLERRVSDASAALNRVAFAAPGHGRLPFLFAQLSQMQLRDFMETGRTALRESRFEDVATAITGARALDVADTAEIDALEQDLVRARGEQRVDEVLVRAAERLEQGSLVAPPNDNARYYYELVLSSEPNNLIAQQGLSAIAAKLVLQARTEIDARRFDAAGVLLEDANRLAPESADVAEATEALAAAREQAQAEQRAREAQQRAAAERAEEERLAAELAEQQRLANERAEAEVRAAMTTEPAAAAAGGEDGGRSNGRSSEPDASDSGGGLLAISELTRVKYVAPKYPRAAERRNLSGWVDVVFTVRADGTTGDIEVRNSEPGDMFVSAALRAVENWEFEPVTENGRIVERQAGVRLMFALE